MDRVTQLFTCADDVPGHPELIQFTTDLGATWRSCSARADAQAAAAGELTPFFRGLYAGPDPLGFHLAKLVLENIASQCTCHEDFVSRKRKDPCCEFCQTDARHLRQVAEAILAPTPQDAFLLKAVERIDNMSRDELIALCTKHGLQLEDTAEIEQGTVMKDHQVAQLVNAIQKAAIDYQYKPELSGHIAELVCAACAPGVSAVIEELYSVAHTYAGLQQLRARISSAVLKTLKQNQELRGVAQDLHACFAAWEPDARVLGNVRAGDGRALMQHVLATGALLGAPATAQPKEPTPGQMLALVRQVTEEGVVDGAALTAYANAKYGTALSAEWGDEFIQAIGRPAPTVDSSWASVEKNPPEKPGRYLVTVATDNGLEVHTLVVDAKKRWTHEGEYTFEHSCMFTPVSWKELPAADAAANAFYEED